MKSQAKGQCSAASTGLTRREVSMKEYTAELGNFIFVREDLPLYPSRRQGLPIGLEE